MDEKELGALSADVRHIREDIQCLREDIEKVDNKVDALAEKVGSKVDALAEKVNAINLSLSTEQATMKQDIKGMTMVISAIVSGAITATWNAVTGLLGRGRP